MTHTPTLADIANVPAASRALATDANGNVVSSTTTDTELGYVAGATSSLQNQINGKASSSLVLLRSNNLYDLNDATTARANLDLAEAVRVLDDWVGSSEPNYPAAATGDAYYVTSAGRAGGAAGKLVYVGDLVLCRSGNGGGNEASVGQYWTVLRRDALIQGNNLSDITSASTARSNLGLGSSATHSTGDFAQTANNLSDLGSASTARTNLGLGTAATQSVGTSAGNVVQLDGSAKLPAVDGSQLTNLPAGSGTLLASNNLSDVTSASTSRSNLGLGTAATLNVGTSANNVVQLNGSAQLPAVDGSLLTNLPSGSGITLGKLHAVNAGIGF